MFVIDTDVVVAGLRSPKGASAKLLAGAIEGRLAIAASVAQVLEYEAVATRAEHLGAMGLTAAQVVTVIDALASVATPALSHFRWRPQLSDPGDEMVLEAAINAGADAIVTFNRRHFATAARRFGLKVILPAQALENMR